MASFSLQALRVGYFSALFLVFLILTGIGHELPFSSAAIENALLIVAFIGLYYVRNIRDEVLLPILLFFSCVLISATVNKTETDLFTHPEFRTFLKAVFVGCALLIYSQKNELNTTIVPWIFRAVFVVHLFLFYYHEPFNRVYDIESFLNYVDFMKNADPNFAAVVLGCGILYLWRLQTLFDYALSVPMIYGLLMTQSRMGIGAFLLCSMFLFKKNSTRILFTVSLFLGLFLSGYGSRFQEIRDNSNAERLWSYQNAVQVIQENPWLGVSWNHAPDTYYEYGFKGPFKIEAQRLHVHNTYLQILAEHGIVGFSVFLFFIIWCFSNTDKLFRPVVLCLLLNALTLPLQNKDFFWLFCILLVVSRQNSSAFSSQDSRLAWVFKPLPF